jgi:hypothetical protein
VSSAISAPARLQSIRSTVFVGAFPGPASTMNEKRLFDNLLRISFWPVWSMTALTAPR